MLTVWIKYIQGPRQCPCTCCRRWGGQGLPGTEGSSGPGSQFPDGIPLQAPSTKGPRTAAHLSCSSSLIVRNCYTGLCFGTGHRSWHRWTLLVCHSGAQCFTDFSCNPQSKPSSKKFWSPFDGQWLQSSKECINLDMALLRFDSKPGCLPEGGDLSHQTESPQKRFAELLSRWGTMLNTGARWARCT